MIEFNCLNSDLIAFIDKCACKGVVLVTSTEKIRKYFYSEFYLEVLPGQLKVKALDSEEKRMYMRHFLNKVDVQTLGSVAITDVELLVQILKSIPAGRKIKFVENEGTITIETLGDGPFSAYRIRQSGNATNILANNSTVSEWDSYNTMETFPILTIPNTGSAEYNTVIEFTKAELKQIIKDSTDLTRDQDIRMDIQASGKDYIVSFNIGKEADNVKGTKRFKKVIVNPIEFQNKILTNLQPIIDHLFSKVTIYLRIAAGDNALKFWVHSKDGNIELNFNSGSA